MKLSSFLHFAAFGVRTILLREKKPILGTVIVTDRCNLKCRHCSVHDLTSVDHPYEQIRREMELLYHMGVRILFFCGGETFLWHDGARTVRDLVVEAKKMGFLLVNVVTNGTFPIDLPEADLILLSLDGDRARHNAIRGDTYDTIMEHVEHATSDNICFYMAINQINKGAVRDVCLAAQETKNVRAVSFNFHTPYPVPGSFPHPGRKGGVLRRYQGDDESGRACIQSARRFPSPDREPLPHAVPPVRGGGKRKTVHMRALH